MTNTGIYIRVKNNDVLLEDLDEVERTLWLESLSQEGLIKTVNRCCDVIEDFIVNYQEVRNRLQMYMNIVHMHYGLQKCDKNE